MAPRPGWHDCRRWFRRGYPCPFRQLGTREDEESDEEEDRRKAADQALPIPFVGERKKDIRTNKIVNIEDYINVQPPVEVPVPGKVAASRFTPPQSGPGEVPLFRPQPGRGGRPGAGVPPPQEAWKGQGAKELARGITAGISPPYDVLGMGAAHSLWRAPTTVSQPMQAKIIHVPRFGQAPLPLYENELVRATKNAMAGKTAPMPSPVLGVRATAAPIRSGFGTPPPELAAETQGVVNTRRKKSTSQLHEGASNNWAIPAVIGSAMAAVAIYALGKGGIGGAAAIEKAITARIPDNRSPKRGSVARGSVRPGGQVFDFWDMLNGIGFQ